MPLRSSRPPSWLVFFLVCAAFVAGCNPGDKQIIALAALSIYGWGAILAQIVLLMFIWLRPRPRISLGLATALGCLGVVGFGLCHFTVLEAPPEARARVVREGLFLPALESAGLVGGALLSWHHALSKTPEQNDIFSVRSPVAGLVIGWVAWLAFLITDAAMLANP